MVFSSFQVLLAVLLLMCFASFAWAVRNFFVKPEQRTVGLKITLLFGSLFALLHLLTILYTVVLPVPAVIAALLYCLGLAMFWWTVIANRLKPLAACFSPNEQLHLVQHGPYRFVRHPFYCSYLLVWLAGAVGTLNLLLGLTCAVMFVLYLIAARKEESKFAASPLAEPYALYRRATGGFLPSPLKLIANRRVR